MKRKLIAVLIATMTLSSVQPALAMEGTTQQPAEEVTVQEAEDTPTAAEETEEAASEETDNADNGDAEASEAAETAGTADTAEMAETADAAEENEAEDAGEAADPAETEELSETEETPTEMESASDTGDEGSGNSSVSDAEDAEDTDSADAESDTGLKEDKTDDISDVPAEAPGEETKAEDSHELPAVKENNVTDIDQDADTVEAETDDTAVPEEGTEASDAGLFFHDQDDDSEFFIMLKDGPRDSQGRGANLYDMTVEPNETITLEAEPAGSAYKDITYTWYTSVPGEYDSRTVIKEGSDSKITVKIERNSTYHCTAVTKSGQEAYISVNVLVDNDLSVTPVSGNAVSSGKYRAFTDVMAHTGEVVDLKLSVSARDKSGITYKWDAQDAETGSDSDNHLRIKVGADNEDREKGYECTVTDRFGNQYAATFWVYNEDIELTDGGLVLYPEGNIRGIMDKTFKAARGEKLKLRAVAKSSAGGVKYSWEKRVYNQITYDSSTVKLKNTTDTLEITADQTCTYVCSVKDADGNSDYCQFSIELNNFSAYPEGADYQVGVFANRYATVIAAKGEKCTLKANVSGDDLSGMKYTWFDKDKKQLASGRSTYQFVASGETTYYCHVEDKYNNQIELEYRIKLGNGVKSAPYSSALTYAAGKAGDIVVFAEDGKQVTLYANAKVPGGNKVTYEWIWIPVKDKNGENSSMGYRAMSGEKSDRITVKADKTKYYRCIIRDQDGNKVFSGFYFSDEKNRAAQDLTASAAGSIRAGSSTTIKTTTKNKAAKITFTSLNTDIATVDASGRVTGIKAGTAKIRVSASAEGPYKSESKTVTINVLPVETSAMPGVTSALPGATKSLTAKNLNNGVRLNWRSVPGANGYLVYRGSSLIKTIKNGAVTTFTDKRATGNKKYTYKLVATSSAGTAKLSKTVSIYHMKKAVLSSAKSKAVGKLTVKWKKNTFGRGYQIQYSLKKNFSKAKNVTIKKNKTTGKTIKGLKKGKKYYVRVRSIRTIKGKKYYSGWSKVKTVKIRK